MMTYLERKLLNRCTRSGCDETPLDGYQLCAPHRDANLAAQKRWRDRERPAARRKRRCPWCRRARLKKHERSCLRCRIQRDRLGANNRANNSDKAARIAAATATHADGRTRYHGTKQRGQQPRGRLDQQDGGDAASRLRRGLEALAYLDEPLVKRQMPAIQWSDARNEALGQIALARRSIDEVLERGRYRVSATTRAE